MVALVYYLIQNIATMLELGLEIDYALLMVSRFREALAAGETASVASRIAASFAAAHCWCRLRRLQLVLRHC